MGNINLDNILQEEQIEDSISYLYNKINNINEKIKKNKIKLEQLQLELKNILYNKQELKKENKNYELFSSISQSILQENKVLNNEVKKIKIKIDKKKLLCLEFEKEKNKINIIINYLEKLKKLKEDCFINVREKTSTEYTNLALLVFETQENEKKRIARDLHDTTVQTLVSMIHKLELSMRVMDTDKVRAKLELQLLIKTLHTTINEMRSMIYDLRPMSVDDIGLVVTLERFARQLTINNQDVEVSVNVKNKEIEMESIVNLNILRVIQESCVNAIKNGKATKIEIFLDYEIDNFFITIVDNGIGFSYNNINGSTKNFGLSIIKERISLLSGEVTINSILKKGTTVKINIPIAKNREIKVNNG